MAEGLDRIFIRDLRCRCIVGIYPEEREKKQEVILNLVLFADLGPAGESDNIEDTVNYKEIKQAVLRLVEASSFLLVERMAKAVADECLRHPKVQRVEVTVDKPGALRFARSVAVQITRTRDVGGDGR